MLLSMVAIGAQAQDDGITSYDLQTPSPEVATEHENRTSKNLVSSRDSLQISDFYQKPKIAESKTTGTGTDTGEEDDALSLNFLFYIIENYKFSDLMDEY